MTKEASLNYVIRKSFELGIDLRKEFMNSDYYKLRVIPRIKFRNLITQLPLGLSESDLNEIYDADL